MDHKMRDSYEKIKISREARERIHQQIITSEDCDDASSVKRDRAGGQRRWSALSGWRLGLAVCLCLLLIIPASVYAAGQISEYFTVSIHKQDYQAEIELHKSDDTAAASEAPEDKTSKEDKIYIRVELDPGEDYEMGGGEFLYLESETDIEGDPRTKPAEGENGSYDFYYHKNDIGAGKDFGYEVIYMNEKEDAFLKLYNRATMEEITVNGHKALLCIDNTVQGSRYSSDYDTEYTLDLYVFYEEYGYIICFYSMQGLGQENLIALAEKITVTEADREKASRYINWSEYQERESLRKPAARKETKKEIKAPVKAIGDWLDSAAFHGVTYQVMDVTVTSQVKDTDLQKFDPYTFTKKNDYWDQSGKLKPYIREKIQEGDGVSQPKKSVVGTEKVQPKMVYVTMKVNGGEIYPNFQLPRIIFLEKEGDKYYNTKIYERGMNRPKKIDDVLKDFMPCYFRETVGGNKFYLKDMKRGEEKTYHFAYMVDGDMTEYMLLCFNGGMVKDKYTPYVDISQ